MTSLALHIQQTPVRIRIGEPTLPAEAGGVARQAFRVPVFCVLSQRRVCGTMGRSSPLGVLGRVAADAGIHPSVAATIVDLHAPGGSDDAL